MTGDAGVTLPAPVPQSAPCLEMSSPSLSLRMKKRVSQLPQHTPNARSAPQKKNRRPSLPPRMSKLNLTMTYTTFKISKSSQSLKMLALRLQAQKPRRSRQTEMPRETSKCATVPPIHRPIHLITLSKRLQLQHLPPHPLNTQYRKTPQAMCLDPPQHLSYPPSRAGKLSKNA